MRALAALLALLVLSAPLAAQNAQVAAMPTQSDVQDWLAVGRLDGPDGGFCTGTLIAPDIVLTAAHCLFDLQSGARLPATDMVFRAGLTRGVSAAERRVVHIVTDPRFRPTEGLNAENVMSDVALLRLETPIMRDVVRPFSVHTGPITKGPVSVVSYGKGRAEMLSRQKRCEVLERYARLIAMDCEVSGGSSGAPVFVHQGERGRVLSVVSGMGHHHGKRVSFGMELATIVSDLTPRLARSNTRAKARVRRFGTADDGAGSGAKFVKP